MWLLVRLITFFEDYAVQLLVICPEEGGISLLQNEAIISNADDLVRAGSFMQGRTRVVTASALRRYIKTQVGPSPRPLRWGTRLPHTPLQFPFSRVTSVALNKPCCCLKASVVIQGASKRTLQIGVQTIHCSMCWRMDSLYVFKCKNFRNTVTFGMPL
jgi:hypothetical protein